MGVGALVRTCCNRRASFYQLVIEGGRGSGGSVKTEITDDTSTSAALFQGSACN